MRRPREKIQARLAAVLPTLRTLAQWLGLAGLAGLACGGAGAAFTWCVAQMEGVKECWYTEDGSNINTTVTEKESGADAAFKIITADLTRETLAEMFESTFGVEPTITDRFFSKFPLETARF